MKPINLEITMGHNIGVSASYYKPKTFGNSVYNNLKYNFELKVYNTINCNS